MGSATPATKTANPGVASPAKIAKTITLQANLDKAYNTFKAGLNPDLGTKTHVPISIYLQKKSSPHEYAGVFDREHHFSGSLVKVAAMFAAYKLLKEANDLAQKIKDGTVTLTANTRDKFFEKLAAQFNLSDAADGITNIAADNKKPSYPHLLNVPATFTTSTLTVAFNSNPSSTLALKGFVEQMEEMIVESNNCSAGECIVRLGFPYINVKLVEDGFFQKNTWNTSQPMGIWLAGDYIQDSCFNKTKKLTYVKIKSVNDCGSGSDCTTAQNTCSKEMADFFMKIVLRELVDQNSSQGMHDLLHKGQQPGAPHTSYLTRLSNLPKKFTIDGVKVGLGPLKGGSGRGVSTVRSEGILIQWIAPTTEPALTEYKEKLKTLNLHEDMRGAICWQNLNDNKDTDALVNIINTAIENFINQTPI